MVDAVIFEEYFILRNISSFVFIIKYDDEIMKNEMTATDIREICEIKSLYFILVFLAERIKKSPF